METKQLSSTESIDLIQKMIATTRENFERNSGLTFLIWGYTSAITTLLIIIAYSLTLNPTFFLGWWAIPIIGHLLSRIITPKPKTKPVRTYIDTFISNTWAVLGVTLMLIPAGAMFTFSNGYLIMPIEGIILSSGVVIMGITIKLPSITIGGIASGLLSFAMFFLFDYAVYLFFLMFVSAMIIPGHILNAKARQQCSKN